MNSFLLALATVSLLAQTPGGTPDPAAGKKSPVSDDESGQSGVIYGDDHAYVLTAPKGWVLDNQVWADQKVFAVLYPRGSSVKGNWVAYSRVMGLNPGGLMAAAIEDLEGMKQQSPDYSWKRLPDIQTSDKNTAIIFSTTGDNLGNAEYLAYIQAPTHVVFISAVTKTPTDKDRLREPFEAIVRSYFWYTDKVITPKH